MRKTGQLMPIHTAYRMALELHRAKRANHLNLIRFAVRVSNDKARRGVSLPTTLCELIAQMDLFRRVISFDSSLTIYRTQGV